MRWLKEGNTQCWSEYIKEIEHSLKAKTESNIMSEKVFNWLKLLGHVPS